MQLVRVFPCLLFVVACGGGGRPQQQPIPDSMRPDGPALDGPESDGPESDGPGSDGPQSTVARIWAIGDIIANNANIAGGFAADATLPFNTATPPTIVVPGGAGVLSAQTDNTFDARGSKIAYVADQTVAGRFDLNVADADGSNPIVVVQGGVANVEISSLALSPDGTKVAFTMDSVAVNGGNDLYFAPTTAGATPVLISPVRVAQADTQDVFSQYEWSADSKFVSFSYDATENNVDQVFVTDTSVATPTPVEILTRNDITATTGVRGVRGRILFDGANNIFFRARISDASAQFTLFKSDTAGNKVTVATPARGDNSVSDIGAFGITPDGATLVFAADAPTVDIFDMYTAPVAAPANQTKITTLAAAGSAQFTAPFAFSPDGTKVAVVANFLAVGDKPFEPVVIALDGSSTKRLTKLPDQAANQDTEKVVWADNNTIFASGDIVTGNVIELFKLDASQEDQTPTLAVGMPTGGDLFNVFAIQP